MERGARAVLAGFCALGVGRGGVCWVCWVCEGQRKRRIVLEIGRKHLSAAVLAVQNQNQNQNQNQTLDLQVAQALALALVLVLV
jgi:hypothetical protein